MLAVELDLLECRGNSDLGKKWLISFNSDGYW